MEELAAEHADELKKGRVRRIIAAPDTPAARIVMESEAVCRFCGRNVWVLSDTVCFTTNSRLFCDACGAPWAPV